MKIFLILIATLMFQPLFGDKHNGPAYDKKPRIALDKLGEKLGKKYNLKMLNTGLGFLADAPDATWCINYTSNQNMTIEQANRFMATLIPQVLHEIYHNPLFAAYYAETNRKGSPYRALANDSVAFKIAFWDANVDRPLFPYLAQIRFTGTAVYYHYANPKTQALEEPIMKTLEDLQITPNQYK